MKNSFSKMPILLSLILFAFSCFLLFFFYKAINSNDEESRSKEAEWQTEANRREEIETLDNSIKIISPERALLETHFAQSSDVVPFLNTIEGLATKVGAKAEVTSVKILEDKTALSVDMQASGTFSSLYKFLTLLENSPYALEFAGVDMRKEVTFEGAQGTSGSKWSAVFKIKLLSFSN
ncbi:hypothetical protein A2917_02735 [Candidatus Nomurabacteria bacterium RIFCSPLOWO2_01_FULL_42_17]|uniref:Uncharacterized protein n=1 Tax=Candidatus Nomurabacteria bacterium RIFCSPLOWO2_01_FULL_42_17 TaxID=1801780 RepID=A0A1F6XMN7_9BACT|nr:MAG: hypothetical protein A2917_02735 [Candidatus Nomurabacteria bacterium RIFCSPLOWO2_01_FULL_42_17]